jgi:hypothetical protein
MDVVKAVQGYITKIVTSASSIKILLLDNNTVTTISPKQALTLVTDPDHLGSNNTINPPQP